MKAGRAIGMVGVALAAVVACEGGRGTGAGGTSSSSAGGGGSAPGGPCAPYVELDTNKPCASGCEAIPGLDGAKYCSQPCSTVEDVCPLAHRCVTALVNAPPATACHLWCRPGQHCPPSMSCSSEVGECLADPNAPAPGLCQPYVEEDPTAECEAPCDYGVTLSGSTSKYCTVSCTNGVESCPAGHLCEDGCVAQCNSKGLCPPGLACDEYGRCLPAP